MTVPERNSIVVRLAGDSGDGIQLAGARADAHIGAVRRRGMDHSGLSGRDTGARRFARRGFRLPGAVRRRRSHARRPRGRTCGDEPGGAKTHLKDLDDGGILIVNQDAFQPAELAKAGYTSDPLRDGSLRSRRLVAAPITALNREAAADRNSGLPPLLSQREVDRCKNFFALGLVYWLFERPLQPTLDWIKDKFARNPAVLEANRRALTAGYHYGETTEALPAAVRVTPSRLPPGRYRTVTGNEALALGLVAAARTSGLSLLYAAYPIAPSSNVLHRLAELKHFGVRTFQAEDEIAAMGAAIGAAFGGGLGATATSGPGLSLKSEALGLAVMAELPVVVVDVQRGGPSLGLPTKTEQTDLFQALYGRHGECPLAVLAARSPADCFATVYEAVRIAVAHMTPVLVLSDGMTAVEAEPWRIPDPNQLPPIPVQQRATAEPSQFQPYTRDAAPSKTVGRAGAPGLEHRIGGLEKEDGSGIVSYDPVNHERTWRASGRRRSPASPTIFLSSLWTASLKAICSWSVGAARSAPSPRRCGGASRRLERCARPFSLS